MDEHAIHGKENEKKQRGFMGRLFKEAKKPTTQVEVDEFLHGTSDKLYIMPTKSPDPPPLDRLNISTARRWPNASEVNASFRVRRRSASPKRSRKGLVVRFSEEKPELIGEGGELAEGPTSEISLRKRARSQPPMSIREPTWADSSFMPSFDEISRGTGNREDVQESPLLMSQNGLQTILDWPTKSPRGPYQIDQTSGEQIPEEISSHRTKDDRRSFAERAKDDIRSGEGLALVASRNSIVEGGTSGTLFAEGITTQSEQLQLNTMSNAIRSDTSEHTASGYPQVSNYLAESSAAVSRTSTAKTSSSLNLQISSDKPYGISRTPTPTLQEVTAVAVGEEALKEFSSRTANMFTLFRLSTEAVQPIANSSFESFVKLGLWWFLRGRLNLEATIRDKPSGSQAQQLNFFNRQQAYADLAKSLWIAETVTSKFPETQIHAADPPLADTLEARQNILSSLRKLAMSMKRNQILPPSSEDTTLVQGLDTKIWVLDEGDKSLIASQKLLPVSSLSESFPLGDTTHSFNFGRIFAEAILAEDGAPQQYRCPVLLSIVRNKKEKALQAIIASPNGSFNFAIQTDKNRGPTWSDVRWYAKQAMVEIYLPRGFIFRLHCNKLDFGTVWRIYDYEKRTHAALSKLPNEELVFESILKSFQVLNESPHSNFGREPQSHCHMRVYEKYIVEKAATGPRTFHRGFRIALVTSPKVKNLRGIDLDMRPNCPIQFSYLRGDDGSPSLLLKIDDGKYKCIMIATFLDVNERTRLHTLFTGLALGHGEAIIAAGSIKTVSLSTTSNKLVPMLESLDWQGFSFINRDCSDLQSCKTVLSEQLRLVIDFRIGTITDRINVGPGELKLRLDTNRPNEIKVFRQPQQDISVSIVESQAPSTLAQDLSNLLDIVRASDSMRTYTFTTAKELHLFQSALTGFSVLFDGFATSFNISRRRMVVPIYKKWDAAKTRIQVVRKEKVTQLVAFFENFSHGDCMNFTLKSTDIFESSTRSGKFSLRIVDAKFALPKIRGDDSSGIDHDFVCLDMPEYPGEHDDITIIFENETALETLIKVLPAPVKIASRIGSVRR